MEEIGGRVHCGHVDVEQVRSISQRLLVSLGRACVEKTTGDLWTQPGAVYGDVKKEMLQYLNVQSQAYADGTSSVVVQYSEELPIPLAMVEDILDSFVQSKKNLLSRVSSKLMYSEKKDEKIEEFVQELDRSGAWMIGRREVLAKALLKRVDKSKMFHCDMTFDSIEKLADHQLKCVLRPVTCGHGGCGAVFSALLSKAHDASCAFKLVSCEQGCKLLVKRGDMDKHCVTFCPMKLINCPFCYVGCAKAFPQGEAEKHCADFMGQHLLLVLQSVQKQEASVGSQAQQILLLEKAISINQRTEAVDIGTALLTIREQDIRLKTLEQELKKLRSDLASIDASTQLSQMRYELQKLQNCVQTSSPPS